MSRSQKLRRRRRIAMRMATRMLRWRNEGIEICQNCTKLIRSLLIPSERASGRAKANSEGVYKLFQQ